MENINLVDKDLLIGRLRTLRDTKFDLKTAISMVSRMPAYKLKHGHWIKDGSYITTADGSLPVYTCSVCKKEIVANDDYDCCPCCMAIMDE